jgi:AcrR family transcriptional regulator
MNARDRKVAIVEAALPLFARKGFAETTTRELARAAGVSEPLLYKHFPSKEALYLAIQDYSCGKNDPLHQKLTQLEPSTASLVRMIYSLMRLLIVDEKNQAVDWNTRHRLMAKSFLEDGAYARLIYKSRLEQFCARIELCLAEARKTGDIVACPVPPSIGALLAHHVGAWAALVHLPKKPAIDYQSDRRELAQNAAWFALRGIGMTDSALHRHFKAVELENFFSQDSKNKNSAQAV